MIPPLARNNRWRLWRFPDRRLVHRHFRLCSGMEPAPAGSANYEVAMWTLPPGDTVLHLLSYVALTAQAMTAALAAGRRSMDWAGVCMLGCLTALGAGTIRDVLLGHYPLVWVQNP